MQSFKNIEFQKKEDNFIRIILYRNYYFDIKRNKLENIKIIDKNTIDSDMNKKREYSHLMFLIERNLDKIRNLINEKPTTIIFPNTYPLIGHVAFGLIDRGTNLIEIKPNTGCNYRCIYCSISEGDNSRPHDFFIDADYLVSEFKKLCKIKKNKVEAYIEPQGEPLLYPQIEYLIKELNKIKKVNRVILNTNGLLLNKKKIDGLKESGLDRINISVDSMSINLEREITQTKVNIKNTLKMIKYSISKGINVMMTPVWMKGINDDEIEKIIKFAKENNATLGIQNYLKYKYGRVPTEQIEFKTFYNKLEELEKKYDMRLILKPEHLDIYKDNQLERAFRRKEVVNVEILGKGRLRNETIGKSRNRLVIIPNSWNKLSGKEKAKVKIIKTKHNINIGIYEK
ncbi:MAG: radical SAM protein [Candidatus Woesearchaeota archaeon]